MGIFDGDLLRRVSAAKDADEVIELIEEGTSSSSGGVVSVDDCCVIIEAAFARGNADLALSVYSAMRSMIGRGEAHYLFFFLMIFSFFLAMGFVNHVEISSIKQKKLRMEGLWRNGDWINQIFVFIRY